MIWVLLQKGSRELQTFLLAAIVVIGFLELHLLVNPHHSELTIACTNIRPTVSMHVQHIEQCICRRSSKWIAAGFAVLLENI